MLDGSPIAVVSEDAHHHGCHGHGASPDTVLLASGQRHTDANVSAGFRDVGDAFLGTARQINDDAMFLDASGQRNAQHLSTEVNRDALFLSGQIGEGFRDVAHGQCETDRNVDANTRYLSGEHHDLSRQVGTGFADTAREHAAQDRNADANARWLGDGQRQTDHGVREGADRLSREIEDVEDEVSDSSRWLHSGQDANAWRLAQQQWADTRYLRDGQDRESRWLDHNIDNGRQESVRGFGRTNEHLSDAERRIEGTDNLNTRYLGDRTQEGERRLAEYGRESERRLTRDLGETTRWTHTRIDDAERRLDNKVDGAERRIEGVVRHGLEEVSESLADHDRRTEVRLQKIDDDVRCEAERTREFVKVTDLETRLYLRDREDRTCDLTRALADRNLDEMRQFERRSRDDETRTRELIRELEQERAERDLIRTTARETQLKNRINTLELELKCCCGTSDPCGCGGRGRRDRGDDDRQRQVVNVTIDDTNRSANWNRTRSGQEIGVGVG